MVHRSNKDDFVAEEAELSEVRALTRRSYRGAEGRDERGTSIWSGNDALSRRDFIRVGGVTGAAIATSGLLAACGSDGSNGSSASGSGGSTANVRPTTTIPRAPFDASSVETGVRPDLPRRMGFAKPSDVEFMQTLQEGIQQACDERDLELIVANANGDPAQGVQQLNSFLTRGVGGMVAEMGDIDTPRDVKLQAIEKGVCVGCTQGAPTTIRGAADQYQIGNVHGRAAVAWIRENLGGEAEVVYFNRLDIPTLPARHQGMLDALRAGGPGIRLVADLTTPKETTQEGFQMTNTVLQAHPNANVWLGADSTIVGTLAALEGKGKVSDNVYLAGVNGDKEALNKILEGGPYKASFAFTYALLGYAWAQYTADWLDGEAVPQVLFLQPIELESRAAIEEFNAASEPTGLDAAFRSGKYLGLKGATSYAVHGNYLTKDF
jgi:ribose transport system substrate-binding protein